MPYTMGRRRVGNFGYLHRRGVGEFIPQALACTAPNGMSPLSDYESSLLAAPAGSTVSYLPTAPPGSPGYIASPSSTAVVPLQNATAGAPPAQAGPDAQPTPYVSSNYPDSTAALVNTFNPYEMIFAGRPGVSGQTTSLPSKRRRKPRSSCVSLADQTKASSLINQNWPWWLLGIAGIVFLVGKPD